MKKFWSLYLPIGYSYFLFTALACMAAASVCAEDGDVNSDGVVNTADVIGIYSYIITGEASGLTLHKADLNGDRKANTTDVVMLYKHIITGEPCCPFYVGRAELLKNGQGRIHLTQNSVKNYKTIDFKAMVEDFDDRSMLKIGHGSEGGYSASWVEINSTSVVTHTYLNTDNTSTYVHNLHIDGDISVIISKEMSGSNATITIESGGERFEHSIKWIGDNANTDGIYAEVKDAVLIDCVMYWSCKALNYDVWMFGDSYFAMDNPARWTYYMIKDGYTDILLNGFPGAKSAEIMATFKLLLDVAKPKTAVWCLGMNNKDNAQGQKKTEYPNAEWLNATQEFISLCRANDIEPILATIPTVVGGKASTSFRFHGAKNDWVKGSGYRYIDFAKAVGANDETGYWQGQGTSEDFLEGNSESSVRVHPTIFGAKAMYEQFMHDCTDIFY